MLIPLGILASSGGAAAGAYELISSTILTGSQASVTFDVSTLASTYKHLQLRMVTKTDRTETDDWLRGRFNSDTGSNYARHRLGGNGSTAYSDAATSLSYFKAGIAAGSTMTSNSYAVTVLDILDFASTSKNKTIRNLSGITGNYNTVSMDSGLWLSTSAITSIDIGSVYGTNLTSGSRLSLYGIKG